MKKFKDSPEWKQFKHKSKDKIAAYLDAMYSQKSPLNEIQDFGEKRSEAIIKAGLDPDERDIQEMVNLDNVEFFNLVFLYHVNNNTNKFQHLCSLQQLLFVIQRAIVKPIDIAENNFEATINSRTNMSKHADYLIGRIEELIQEIFSTKDVAEKAEKKIRRMVTLEERLQANV